MTQLDLLEEARERIQQRRIYEAELKGQNYLDEQLKMLREEMNKLELEGDAVTLSIYIGEYRKVYFLRYPPKLGWWGKLKAWWGGRT
jgi:hypothetical protein